MKSFKASAILIASAVGAGFASGSELVELFGVENSISIFIVPIIIALSFAVNYVVLSVANIHSKTLFGFRHCFELFNVLSSLIILSLMLAGITSLTPIKFPLIAICLGIVGVYIVNKGIKQINNLVAIVVCILILLIVVVFFVCSNNFTLSSPFNGAHFPKSLLWVCFNAYLSSPILCKLRLNKKQRITSCAVASIALGLLILLSIITINSNTTFFDKTMPLLQIAQSKSRTLGLFMTIVIFLAMFSSLCTSLFVFVEWTSTFIKDKHVCGMIGIVLAFLVSCVGFNQIISIFYPLIGFVGLLHTIAQIMFLLNNKTDAYQQNTTKYNTTQHNIT